MPIAFVCVTTEPASMAEVLKALKAVEEVEEAEMVYGIYDIIAKVKGDSIASLRKIIIERIRKIDKVMATTTMMVVKSE
ncbi:MAG: Lrp/AsnC family transcriptional regulator [Candidatus Bathyarchaeota archaeon]|nr:MAG: Lrp/AsnC family transcriptional regulator [Candidatus Bathyarchaeota archaeon]